MAKQFIIIGISNQAHLILTKLYMDTTWPRLLVEARVYHSVPAASVCSDIVAVLIVEK